MHTLLAALFALALLPVPGITPPAALIIFLAAVFIDVDHYLPYALARKDFSLKNAYSYHEKFPKNHPTVLNVLHTLEVFTLLLIIGAFHPLFLLIFIGFTFHSLFDMVEMISKNQLVQREYSLINYFLSKKKNYLNYKTFDPEKFINP